MYGNTSQKMAFLTVTAKKTSNLKWIYYSFKKVVQRQSVVYCLFLEILISVSNFHKGKLMTLIMDFMIVFCNFCGDSIPESSICSRRTHCTVSSIVWDVNSHHFRNFIASSVTWRFEIHYVPLPIMSHIGLLALCVQIMYVIHMQRGKVHIASQSPERSQHAVIVL
jgi:hypothetical protein